MSRYIDDDATAPLPPVDETRVAQAPTRAYAAQVNLLPLEIIRQRRHQRIAVASVGALAVYLLLLTVLYIMQGNDVAEARAERDAAQERVVVLQAEVDGLSEFQALLDDIATHEDLLTAVMRDELSWARIFGDLALAFSNDASLTQVDAVTVIDETADETAAATATPGAATPTASEPAAAQPAASEAAPGAGVTPTEATDGTEGTDGETATAVAELTFSGYTVTEFAPGVAEVLSNFADAEGFFDAYLATAAEEERGGTLVTKFEGSVDLDERAYTRRYDDGMPEESLR